MFKPVGVTVCCAGICPCFCCPVLSFWNAELLFSGPHSGSLRVWTIMRRKTVKSWKCSDSFFGQFLFYFNTLKHTSYFPQWGKKKLNHKLSDPDHNKEMSEQVNQLITLSLIKYELMKIQWMFNQANEACCKWYWNYNELRHLAAHRLD